VIVSAADLRAALEAELEASKGLKGARARLYTLVDQAVAAGTSYDTIARLALRVRMGRSPTTNERFREVQRLRQRRRRSVTACHGNLPPTMLTTRESLVGSGQEVSAMPSKLIKRTTTTEEFLEDEDPKDCDDEKEEVEEDEDGDDDKE
jgi:hypothetical protein